MTYNSSLRVMLLASATALISFPALAKVPVVVTDIPAIGSMVQQVMGDLGSPTVLMDQGGDPHNYQLRPSQAAELQDADLLIWVGPELAPWLERSATSLAEGKSLPLLALPDTLRRDFASEHDHGHEGHDHAGHDHEGHDHEGHDHEGHDHGHEGHSHDGTDPHAWLDPTNGQYWIQQIAVKLAENDAENAATYQANADKAVKELAALDSKLKAQLEPVKAQSFVVFHDAYGYFTQHYGLKPAIPVSLGDASAPSAARLKKVQGEIAESGATCAFPEANHDAKLLRVVTEGTGAREGRALDPEGNGHGQGAGLYPAILEQLGLAISDCLTGKE